MLVKLRSKSNGHSTIFFAKSTRACVREYRLHIEVVHIYIAFSVYTFNEASSCIHMAVWSMYVFINNAKWDKNAAEPLWGASQGRSII